MVAVEASVASFPVVSLKPSAKEKPDSYPVSKTADFSSLEETLGLAFAKYPVLEYVFQGIKDDSDRAKAAGWALAQGEAASVFKTARVYTDPSDPEKKAAFVCVGHYPGDGDQKQASVCSMLCGSMLAFPFTYGIAATLRGIEVDEYHNAVIQELWGEEKRMFYLGLIGTHPKWQGKGVGTRAMRSVLREFERSVPEGGDCVVTLVTHLERNVGWYSRLGFEVVRKDVFKEPSGEGKDAFAGVTAWFMERRFGGRKDADGTSTEDGEAQVGLKSVDKEQNETDVRGKFGGAAMGGTSEEAAQRIVDGRGQAPASDYTGGGPGPVATGRRT